MFSFFESLKTWEIFADSSISSDAIELKFFESSIARVFKTRVESNRVFGSEFGVEFEFFMSEFEF